MEVIHTPSQLKMKAPFVDIVILFLMLFSGCAERKEIAYVNSAKVLRLYHGAIAQHEIFQSKARAWQQQIDSLSKELNGSGNKLNPSFREQQVLHYREAIQQKAQQEDQRITKAVLDDINSYITEYGKRKNYLFILGATESGNIVYAAKGADITDDVLRGLNDNYDRQHPFTK